MLGPNELIALNSNFTRMQHVNSFWNKASNVSIRMLSFVRYVATSTIDNCLNIFVCIVEGDGDFGNNFFNFSFIRNWMDGSYSRFIQSKRVTINSFSMCFSLCVFYPHLSVFNKMCFMSPSCCLFLSSVFSLIVNINHQSVLLNCLFFCYIFMLREEGKVEGDGNV